MRGAFCAPSTPLSSSSVVHPAAHLVIPELEDAQALSSILHPPVPDRLEGSLLPATSNAASDAYALGICAHWHSATQDVDFERKLLLRALLATLPAGTCLLPSGCASIDELDLAPLKVHALLEALAQGRRGLELTTAEFRWDVKQPPPKFVWGGDEPGGRHAPE